MSRILEINTPLGAENTLLTAMTGTESLGVLPEYRLTLVSKRGNLTAADLLGKNVTAGVELPGRQEMRYFNGYITHFSEAGTSAATWFEGTPVAHQYELTMHPWLWFLTRRANFRIFQNKTVPQIVQEVCGEYPFAQLELKLSGTYAVWEYCCQYRESDFNFVLRLLEQEGIYFSFKHENGKHTMVLFDDNGRHTPRDGYAEIAYDVDGTGYEQREHITMWSASRSVQPGRYTLNDFDFKKPDVSLISTLGKALPHDMSGFELFDFPGEYETVSEGSRYAQVRLEEMHARHEVFMAAGSVRGIESGCKFKLANHPDESFNREYLITTARFTIINNQASSSGGAGGQFHCTFEALDLRTQFRPPRVTPRPAVQGPQTAIVVGPPGEEIHVDEHGRVKLQFQWDRYNQADDKSSCWVRVSQPWSGKGWGALFLPRVGHEVIVQFIDGDPDHPIVVGRVHNGQSIPPWSMKDQKTRSGFRTRTEKGGASNFNELSFDDKKGAEEIYLHAERNHVLRVKNNRVEEIGNESHLTVQKDVFVNLKADLHEQVTGDHNNGVDGTFSLKVGQDWQTKAGLKFAVDAGREIHLKAGVNVVIEAGASISLKVGGSFVSIHPGGVDIEGPLVKVNSGGSPGSGSGAAPIAPKAAQRPRGSKGGTNMKPVRPKKPDVYSPKATAMKLAWTAGAPFCEQCQNASAQPLLPAVNTSASKVASNLDKADNLLAQARKSLVGAIPFIGKDLAEDGGDDLLKVIDPYQAAVDATRSATKGDYLAAGVAAASVVVRPAKAAGRFATEGVVITEKGLALVEQNLARFERWAPNEAIVQSLRESMLKGARAYGSEANFYLHEIAENTGRLNGLNYFEAHAAALKKYEASEFMLYGEKVIRQFPSEFNKTFRKFWGMKND
ncbi:type VI secretion system Vgr family protein [Massilia horti]|uniref:Type VI secretion system tip protein VgrG n=1 Tax=Massilia horti TaxID=2562153 RepID=A0A4Y9T3M5_9BURK|nr:type VI secretion system tip protein VgrG [Massilia horti]TFW33901.1 type VI secretion system tip protein VgrG [Massilia horti]